MWIHLWMKLLHAIIGSLWPWTWPDLVSRNCIESGAYLLYSLRLEFQIRCVNASWDGRVSHTIFWVTVTLTSDLFFQNNRVLCISLILFELRISNLVGRSILGQGWQSTGQYAYWPDQWSILVLTGHYWSIGGQLVDWKKHGRWEDI